MGSSGKCDVMRAKTSIRRVGFWRGLTA